MAESLRNMTPAQRIAYMQQQQAQIASRYNPSNAPTPGPGVYIGTGESYQTNDGRWFKTPGAGGNGQFVATSPPPNGGMPAIPAYPPGGINIGGAGPRFNMPGSGQQPWQSGDNPYGVNFQNPDPGNPLGRRGLGTLDFTRPTTPTTDPTTPTDPAKTDPAKTDPKKGTNWQSIIDTILKLAGPAAGALTAALEGRARARAAEAINARQEDDLNLRRAALGIRAPGVRAGQAAYGDFLANYQDVNIDVPGVAKSTITGGWDPGPTARAAGSELSKQALEKLMSGEDLPELSERPDEPGWLDKFLEIAGYGLTGAQIYDEYGRAKPRTPTTAPRPPTTPTTTSGTTTAPPTPLPVAGVTPGVDDWDAAAGLNRRGLGRLRL